MYKFVFAIAITAIACHAIPTSSRQGIYNRYIVYTVNNTRQGIEIDVADIASVEGVLLASRNTTVIVHGHQGSASTSLNPTVKDSLLSSQDVNVIIVDWSVYASLSYSNAVSAVPNIGNHLAETLSKLVEANVVSLDKLHLVGFDLGAHVVGFAGRILGGNVARITGLDPSGNQWGSNSLRLRVSDALYVEVLHTDGEGILANGIGDAIGNVDIYVNGGTNQPGCFLNNRCSHNRAWEVFAASVEFNHLVASQCGSKLQVSLNLCTGRTLQAGNNELDKLGSGLYRLNTRRSYPY